MPSGDSTPQHSAPPRLVALDALRGIAVLLVLGRHMPEAAASIWAPLRIWHRAGWIGVDLFFVLSGFLVAGLLFREYLKFGNIRCGRFLLRRGLKIYPAFYALLLVTWAVAWWTGKTLPVSAVVCEALFIQNYGPALFPQSWSLAVEEHFYLLLPLLIVVLYRTSGNRQRDPFRKLPIIFLTVATLSLTARIAVNWSGDFHLKTHLFPTHLRMDALLFGVLLSYAWHFHFEWLSGFVRRWRMMLGAAAVGLVLPAFLVELEAERFLPSGGLTCLYIASGICLLLAVFHEAHQRMLAQLFAVIGTYSYSIYLWHIPVRFWVVGPLAQKLDLGAGQTAALYLSLSILAGGLMAKLIELPALAVRNRWLQSRSAAAHSQPSQTIFSTLMIRNLTAPATSAMNSFPSARNSHLPALRR